MNNPCNAMDETSENFSSVCFIDIRQTARTAMLCHITVVRSSDNCSGSSSKLEVKFIRGKRIGSKVIMDFGVSQTVY